MFSSFFRKQGAAVRLEHRPVVRHYCHAPEVRPAQNRSELFVAQDDVALGVAHSVCRNAQDLEVQGKDHVVGCRCELQEGSRENALSMCTEAGRIQLQGKLRSADRVLEEARRAMNDREGHSPKPHVVCFWCHVLK